MTMERNDGALSARSAEGSSSSATRSAKLKKAKASESSRRGVRNRKNVVVTKGIPKLNAKLRAELATLDAVPDDQIDTSDIPEWTESKGPVYVGLMHRPGKTSVTIRLDEDMVAWFKRQGKGWQTKMNWVLRLYFASHRKTGVKVGRP